MLKRIVFTTLLAVPMVASSATFSTWTTNEGDTGNYILTVTEQATDGVFDFNLTVNPWNAEALGLFVDFGDFNFVGTPTLSNVTPVGEVSLFAFDTASDSCGAGCNLEGLNPPLATPDGQWELVLRLGSQGFDSIQTFSFTIGGLTGRNDTDIALVGIRAQQLCSGTDLLPGDIESCEGSDKSYGSDGGGIIIEVPEPGMSALMGIGLLALALAYSRRVIS